MSGRPHRKAPFGFADRVRRRLGPRSPRDAAVSFRDLRSQSLSGRVAAGREQVERAGAPGAWHVAPQDCFVGVEGLPEIDFAEATADHVAAGLQHHGALVIREMLDPGSVDRLLAFVSEENVQVNTLTLDPACEPMLDAFSEVYQMRGVRDLAEAYLGELPVAMAHRVVVSRRRRETKGLRWHQDAPFFGGACHSVNTWIALSPCDDERPGLDIVPQRIDRVIDPGNRGLNPSDVVLEEAEALTSDTPAIQPALAPGDAILLDEMTLHRSAWSPEPSLRDAAMTWWFAPSRFPTSHGTPLSL